MSIPMGRTDRRTPDRYVTLCFPPDAASLVNNTSKTFSSRYPGPSRSSYIECPPVLSTGWHHCAAHDICRSAAEYTGTQESRVQFFHDICGARWKISHSGGCMPSCSINVRCRADAFGWSIALRRDPNMLDGRCAPSHGVTRNSDARTLGFSGWPAGQLSLNRTHLACTSVIGAARSVDRGCPFLRCRLASAKLNLTFRCSF